MHLFWPPFSVFAPKGQVWVGNFWLEDVIWTWLVFGVGIMKLREKKLTIEHYFAGLFFLSTLFVAHRDIGRYILPIAPFVLIGWDSAQLQQRWRQPLQPTPKTQRPPKRGAAAAMAAAAAAAAAWWQSGQ